MSKALAKCSVEDIQQWIASINMDNIFGAEFREQQLDGVWVPPLWDKCLSSACVCVCAWMNGREVVLCVCMYGLLVLCVCMDGLMVLCVCVNSGINDFEAYSFHRAGELLAGLGIDDFDEADFVKARKVGSR